MMDMSSLRWFEERARVEDYRRMRDLRHTQRAQAAMRFHDPMDIWELNLESLTWLNIGTGERITHESMLGQ